MMHPQRGQALVETAAFLPLMLLAMMAILYFGKFGVLQERAAVAARYASLVSNAGSGSSVFSLKQMYAELHREGNNSGTASFPSGNLQCASSAADDASTALTMSQNLPSGGVGATAPPYFRPNGAASTHWAGTTCVPLKISLTPNDADVASFYYVVQYTDVEADVNVPVYLQKLVGGPTSRVRAAMSNVRPASPDDIIYCSPNFASAIASSLGALEPVTQAGPFAGYQTPPPGNPHVC